MGCCAATTQIDYVEILDRCSAPGVTFSEEMRALSSEELRNVVCWLPETKGEAEEEGSEGLPVPVQVQLLGVVLICHGLNEHSLRYHGVAIALARAGFAVYGVDHMAHGKSVGGGKKGIFDRSVMIADFVSFGKYAKAQHPTLPSFLLAHSMGTLVGLMAVNELEPRAAIFSGCPLVAGPAAASPFGISCLYPLTQTSAAAYVTSITAAVDPGGLAAPLQSSGLTHDEGELETNRLDPRMCPPLVTNKAAYELVQLLAEVKVQLPLVTVPFLCMHGAEDTVALPKGSEYIYKNAGTDITQRQLLIIPNARHEPFHETKKMREDAVRSVVDYLVKQVPPAF
ncbi:Alpha/Beta hydrolase protein [Ochromonadaceae sp. CCMP2298]|nr:Alpha/Beta hydrolase protein [Ochromonadaceae sp. CCMP2298]|mmetsp:Transcript_9597/g.21247  ORF Transcript_9597/g.21247 Transcript_9597/m.21247 type:complete len:340 (-) Transcript_9597:196-1215(-)